MSEPAEIQKRLYAGLHEHRADAAVLKDCLDITLRALGFIVFAGDPQGYVHPKVRETANEAIDCVLQLLDPNDESKTA